jgi:hypothetical protein
MKLLTLFPFSVISLAALSACARGPGENGDRSTSTKLVRVLELPAATGDASSRPPGPFGGACAMVVRDPTTGIEYLLSRTRIVTGRPEGTTTTAVSLLSATADYLPVSTESPSDTSKGGISVDCVKSLVLQRKLPD